MSPLRMLVHALAFVLYVFVYASISFIAYLVSKDGIKDVFYVHWVVCIIVGFISYISFFFVLWHLGSKDPNYIEFSDKVSESTNTTS